MVRSGRKCNEKASSVVIVPRGVPTRLLSPVNNPVSTSMSCSLKLGMISFQSSTSDVKIQIFHRCYFYHVLASRVAEEMPGASLTPPVTSCCLEAFDSYILILEIEMCVFFFFN